MVETFAAEGADEPVDVWILPGRAGRDEDLLDAHASHAAAEAFLIDAVPIPQQVARTLVVREGFDNLLGRPGGCGVRRHVEVDGPAPGVAEDEATGEDAKPRRGHPEEVDGGDLATVI